LQLAVTTEKAGAYRLHKELFVLLAQSRNQGATFDYQNGTSADTMFCGGGGAFNRDESPQRGVVLYIVAQFASPFGEDTMDVAIRSDDNLFVLFVNEVASERNVDSGLEFVAREHPEEKSGIHEVNNRLWHKLLQFILDCSGTEKDEVLLDLVLKHIHYHLAFGDVGQCGYCKGKKKKKGKEQVKEARQSVSHRHDSAGSNHCTLFLQVSDMLGKEFADPAKESHLLIRWMCRFALYLC